MALIMGIVGLPNVGKSSLFNALTSGNAHIENRPFSTIDPNVGVAQLVDERLDVISKLAKARKTVPATVKFLDIAGLVKGAHQGEGLGNKFLENIRGVDAICLVVRAFEDSGVFTVLEKRGADPVFEAEIVLCELVYADLEMVTNVIKKLKSNDPRIEVLTRIKSHLEQNNLILNFPFTDKEKQDLKIYSFLTDKPMIILANTDDGIGSRPLVEEVKAYSERIGASFLCMNIKLEREIGLLGEEDRKEFLDSLGRSDSCLNLLIRESFGKLGLSTFFTAGEQEARAWTYRRGSTASRCAGLIHTDIEKGFIKARVIKYGDYVEHGDLVALKKAGKVAYEGRDYIVQDGDIIHFEFRA